MSKHFCNCPSQSCPHHPNVAKLGCDPCIEKNLKAGEIPACFFRLVSDDIDALTDYSIEGFVRFYTNLQSNQQ